MKLKSKILAAFSALAVSGIVLTGSAHAAKLTPLEKIQTQLTLAAGPNVVLVNPGNGQTYATDAQFAAAVLASINTKKVSQKNSPKDALQTALGLAVADNPNYRYASTTILSVVSSNLAKNTTKLSQALAGAFAGFQFTSVTSNNSAAAALIDSSLLGIKQSGLSTGKLNAAYTAATKAAVKASVSFTASPGASVGASAQFINSSLLSTIIKSAVSKAYLSYQTITEAIATAVNAVSGQGLTDVISSAVLAGYKAGFAATHGGVPASKNKIEAAKTAIADSIASGYAQTTGAGATGLNNYAYVNLSAGPVTDIYGL